MPSADQDRRRTTPAAATIEPTDRSMPAGRDHERHADREHADDASLAQHVEDVVLGRERVGLRGSRRDDQQQDDDADERVLLQLDPVPDSPNGEPPAGVPRGRWSSDLLRQTGCVGGRDGVAQQLELGRAPRPSTSATSSPSRMTRMRVQMPDQLLELGRHDEDAHARSSRARRSAGRSRPWSPTSTPRVGSSSSSTRQWRSSQRASTTFCWLPPDSSPDERGRGSSGTVLSARSCVAGRLALARARRAARGAGSGRGRRA